MEGLNKLSKEIHQRNIEKGFWDDKDNPKKMAANLALVHSEVSEALECDRKNKYMVEPAFLTPRIGMLEGDTIFAVQYNEDIKGTFEEEMADIIIRVLDLCAYKNVDIESHIKLKMRYNALRPHKHGKNY